jgi:hypothetical protein
MTTAARLTILVDDIRTFADGRPHLRLLDSRQATTALRSLADSGLPIAELWLDYHLGPSDSVRPVLRLLEELDDLGHRLAIRRVIAHTSDPAGAREIERTCRQLQYEFQRVTITRDVLVP